MVNITDLFYLWCLVNINDTFEIGPLKWTDSITIVVFVFEMLAR